jgi:hypothetical protein
LLSLVLVLSGHISAGHLWTSDPSSTGTLTHVKMIEMFVESAFATNCVTRGSELLPFVLVRTYRSCMHVIMSLLIK